MSAKPPAIIVNLDGTLANCDHRRHHVMSKPKNWKAFYGGIDLDLPNLWCLDLVSTYTMAATSIILVSGRPDDHRAVTERWLDRYNVTYDRLIMRAAGDNRDDMVVKKELYQKQIEPYYKVIFTVDDRKRVVDMWRSLGLICLHCAEGNY